MTEKEPSGFAGARAGAEEIAQDPGKVAELLDAATAKADRWAAKRASVRHVMGQFKALFRLVRAYYSGQYRAVPWETILMAVAAILYFVMPLDLVPDFIAGLGLLDDAALLSFVVAAIRVDLHKFLAWEKKEALPPA